MPFISVPILEKMKTFYESTLTQERFSEYLKLLQRGTKDLIMPISGYNPMAKDHIHLKIDQLVATDAERIARETLYEFNKLFDTHDLLPNIEVVINVADDLKGGWTNRFTTDYDSKFKLSALIERNFCSPFFWTSEEYTTELVRERVLQYSLRTFYTLNNGKPQTLKDHVSQELFVIENSKPKLLGSLKDEFLENYYDLNKSSTDYNLIFNFLYGDEVSKSLNYPTFGITGSTIERLEIV